MLTHGDGSESGEETTYLIHCDGCSFAETAAGRDEAVRIGHAHQRETDHDVVAVEAPPTVDA